ncbi:hypothetical protein Tco_1194717 [Tanacetum coccineum]
MGAHQRFDCSTVPDYRIIDTTQAQQKALDDALVAPVNRLNIRNCNLRLRSTLKSKKPTLQVVLDALKLTPFFKAFKIIADIFPKLTGQKFKDPPFEEEILLFIRDLGNTGEIKGMYHNKHVDDVYLLWEDLVYQVENKNSNKNNDMCYPRFTKVIINYFMTKDPSIPRRNKMFWHTARHDSMFITIRVIFKYQDTQIYGAILPRYLTNQDMIESEAYKKKANSDTTPKKMIR